MGIVITDRSAQAVEVTVVYPRRKLSSETVNVAEQLAVIGRELWRELHSDVTFDHLLEWESKIPSYGCSCKLFYHEWKASNPPRKDDFFAWTVELHNAVNAKLGKPIITLQQAREIWMT